MVGMYEGTKVGEVDGEVEGIRVGERVGIDNVGNLVGYLDGLHVGGLPEYA